MTKTHSSPPHGNRTKSDGLKSTASNSSSKSHNATSSPEHSASMIAKWWHSTSREQASKQTVTPNDTVVVKLGNKEFKASRSRLNALSLLPSIIEPLRQDHAPISIESVKPECAEAFLRYLEHNIVSGSQTELRVLSAAAKTHHMLELRQRAKQALNRDYRVKHRRLSALGDKISSTLVRPSLKALVWFQHKILYLSHYKSRWADTSVGPIHYLDAAGTGSLPTIVVLHGVTMQASDYVLLLHKLQQQCCRVIAPDLLGHGKSRTASGKLNAHTMAISLIEALDSILSTVDGPVVVFGNSLGGIGATLYAIERPDRVNGLFLCSPGGAPVTDDELPGFLDTFRVQSASEGRTFYDRLFVSKLPIRRIFGTALRAHLTAPWVGALMDSVKSSDFLDSATLKQLKTRRILFCWGKEDHVLPDRHRQWWHRHLPARAQRKYPNHFGHVPIFSDLKTCTLLICQLLEQVQTDWHNTQQTINHSHSHTASTRK